MNILYSNNVFGLETKPNT